MLRRWHCFSFHWEISRDDRGWAGMKMVEHARNFSPSGEISFKSQCRCSYANADPYIDSDEGRHCFLFSIEMKLHHKHRRDYVKSAFIPRDIWPLLDLDAWTCDHFLENTVNFLSFVGNGEKLYTKVNGKSGKMKELKILLGKNFTRERIQFKFNDLKMQFSF